MNAWQTVLLVVVILVVLAVLAWAASRRQRTAKREEQARAHLTEARERQARAESTRAAADEQAARLRRERAELEQRMAQQERESAQLADDAERDAAKAAELQARARKLAPHLADEDLATGAAPAAGAIREDHAGRHVSDGVAEPTLLGTPAPDGYDDRTRADDRTAADETAAPATSYRHTAPVTDPEEVTPDRYGTVADGTYDTTYRDRDRDGDGRPDGSVRERLDGDRDATVVDREPADGTVREETDREETVRDETVRDETMRDETMRDETMRDETMRDETDRDGDGVPDDEERGGLQRLKDRLTGRVDERDAAAEDQAVTDAGRRRP
jgi:hypothetical protein